jgi:DNA repair protein RecO
MGAGFAALELLRELSAEHQPDSTVFATALSLLAALDAEEEVAPEPLLLCFQLRLLALLGFAPRLDQCGLCGKRPAATQAGCFDPRLGTLVCNGCGGAPHRLSGNARGQLMAATGPDWLRVAGLAWPERQAAAARDALRAFVEQRIGRKLSAASLFPVGAVGEAR